MPVSRSNGVDIWREVHKVLPGTGHACCLEDPAGFDRLVMDFLQARKLMPGLQG
jgi:pimeloyl-ACP methyl ester carboxylesterase